MKQLFVFLLLFSVISCKSKTNKETSGYIFQKIRTDSIRLDSVTTPEKNGISFFIQDDTIKNLFLLNRLTNTLYAYDWKTKSQINKIKFEKEGPNGVGEINYIYAKNLDSIFALNNYAYSLILFNQNGKRLSKYKLLDTDSKFDVKTMTPPTGSYSILPTGGWESPMICHNSILYIAGFPNLNPYEENFFTKSNLSIAFDLTDRKIKYFASYPQFYKDNKYFPTQSLSYFWTYNIKEKKIIYSFPDDTYIHIYNFSGEKLKSIEIKSSFFDKTKPMAIKKLHNPEKDLIHYMSASHFDRLIYDA